MGHGFVIKFVGDDTLKNKGSVEAGVLCSLQHSWKAGTAKPLLKFLGSEPGFSIRPRDRSSTTSSLPFGSYYDTRERVSQPPPASPPNKWVRASRKNAVPTSQGSLSGAF